AIYTHAGPEIGGASNHTFTATVAHDHLMALVLAMHKGFLRLSHGQKRLAELAELPPLLAQTLQSRRSEPAPAPQLVSYGNFLFLGRGLQYPIALEGALKLKEISYIHAEGYAAGEMKHGPIALIDERMPVIALTPRDACYDRMMGNVEEVRARGGRVIA